MAKHHDLHGRNKRALETLRLFLCAMCFLV